MKKIITFLLTGLGIISFSWQYGTSMQKSIGNGFKHAFEKALDCKIEGNVEKVSLFSPTITLTDVSVAPADRSTGWKWTAKKYVTKFSWWHLFYHRCLDLQIDMSDVVAHTDCDNNNFTILPHLQKMALGDPMMPIFIKNINLEKATFIATDSSKNKKISLSWNSKTKRVGQALHTHMTLIDGEFGQNEKQYIKILKGVCEAEVISEPELSQCKLQSSCKLIIDNLFKEPLECEIEGHWDLDKGLFNIKTSNQSLAVSRLHMKIADKVWSASVKGRFPLTLLSDLNIALPMPFEGIGFFELNAIFNDEMPKIHGTLATKNVMPLCSEISCSFDNNDNQWQGNILLENNQYGNVYGVWKWDPGHNDGLLTVCNVTPFYIPCFTHYVIKPQEMKMHMHLNSQGVYEGSYTGILTAQEQRCALEGDFSIKNNKLLLSSEIDLNSLQSLLNI